MCLCVVVYQGYRSTDKYIGKPVTTEESLMSVAEFPELRLSICKQMTIEECKVSPVSYTYNIFDQSYYTAYEYEYGDECVFPDGVVPNYAMSYDQFWADLERREVSFRIADLVEDLSVWNKSTNAWDVLINGKFTDESLFRTLLNAQ